MVDDPIALAGGLFETRSVDDLDLAPPVSNKARRLKRPRNQRDRRPPCAEHLGEEVLREGYGRSFRLQSVLGLQQPACQSRHSIMGRVACRYLLCLDPQDLGVCADDFPDACALRRSALERLG